MKFSLDLLVIVVAAVTVFLISLECQAQETLQDSTVVEKQLPELRVNATNMEIIGEDGRIALIHYSGKVEFGKNYEPDDAAIAFWDAVAITLQQNQDRIVSMLTKLEILRASTQNMEREVLTIWTRLNAGARQ